jgi:hypothetical protein
VRARREPPLSETTARLTRCGHYAHVVAEPSTEYQVTYWRDLPSLVVAREGDQVTKSPLTGRFQEAIDEAAMRLGDTGSEDYLAGWRRTEWIPVSGSTTDVADRVVAGLEGEWPAQRLQDYLDALGPAKELS